MRKPGQNLTYAIAEQLGQAVVTQTYGKAVPFPIEAELCKQFGASRTVLREAVKMLTAKGLLNARPRQGTWVQSEDRWNMLDPDVLRWLMERKFSLRLLTEFTQIRLAIEPMAARLAATDATPAGIARIREAIERMQAAARGEDDPLESDIAFHVAVLHATGNRFYAQLDGLTNAALRISIRFTNTYKGVRLADVGAHKRVADAIAAGKPDRAQAEMDALLREVMDLISQAQRAADLVGRQSNSSQEAVGTAARYGRARRKSPTKRRKASALSRSGTRSK